MRGSSVSSVSAASVAMGVKGMVALCVLSACSVSGQNCQPYPTGFIVHNVTSDVISPGDVIHYDFHLDLNLTDPVTRVVINITATSLKFSDDNSSTSVAWQLTAANGTVADRNSSSLMFSEEAAGESAWVITLEGQRDDNSSLDGSLDMTVADGAGSGDLVQSEVTVTVVRADNGTCLTAVRSPYFYLPPPRLWLSGASPQPVAMMQQLYTVLNVRLEDADHLAASSIEVRTPSEESSREVILTIQSVVVDHVTGFIGSAADYVKQAVPSIESTFGSFQNDIARLALPPLQRDDVNFTQGALGLALSLRAEDYSQLRDADVTNVTVAFALGGPTNDVSSGGVGGGGAHLIWVSGVAATLQAPPLELKRPVLNLTIGQKSSCAFDGETQATVELHLSHHSTSSASAYNISARVYLPPALTLLRHYSSELRQNSLSVTQHGHVLHVDIQRMTFSDQVTVTLKLDIDLDSPRAQLAEQHVIMADAGFTDRWGNETGMFTAMNYVKLKLDNKCSQHVSWLNGTGTCACAHDASRADCACCVSGACQCGSVNPGQCQPCVSLHLCQPYLPGFDRITELDVDDGQTTYICDAHHRYRAWSKGISCYLRSLSGGTYSWYPMNAIVGAITAHDPQTGTLFGISNNGLAHMRSADLGVTWYTIKPEDYASQLSSVTLRKATLISGQLGG